MSQQSSAGEEDVAAIPDNDLRLIADAYKVASQQFMIDINNLRKQIHEQRVLDASLDSLWSVSDFFSSSLDEFYQKYNSFCQLFKHSGVSSEAKEKGACFVAEFLKTETLFWEPNPLEGPITTKNYHTFLTAGRHVQVMGAIYNFFANYIVYLSNHGKVMEKTAAGSCVAEIIERKITLESCRAEDGNLINCDLFTRLAGNRREHDVLTRSIQTDEDLSFIDMIKLSFDKLLPKSLERAGVFIPNEIFPFSFSPDVQETILASIAKAHEDEKTFSVLKDILCKTEQMVYMAETRLWLLEALWKDTISKLRWKPASKVFDIERGFQISDIILITDKEKAVADAYAAELLAEAEEEAEKAKASTGGKGNKGRKKRSSKPQSSAAMGGGSAGAGTAGKSSPGASGAPVSAMDTYSRITPTKKGPLYKVIRGRQVLVSAEKMSGASLGSEHFPPLPKALPAATMSVAAPHVPATAPEPTAEPLPAAGAGTGAGAEAPVPTSLPDAAQPAPQAPRIKYEEDEAAFDAFIADEKIPNYRKKALVACVLGALYRMKGDPSKRPYLAKVVHLILENEDLEPRDFNLKEFLD